MERLVVLRIPDGYRRVHQGAIGFTQYIREPRERFAVTKNRG